MYYLIESQHQFEEFTQQQTNRCFVELILNHNLIHPALNDVSLVYIRPEGDKKGYIIPILHNEAFSTPFQQVKKLIASYKEVFVRDKKLSMYFLNKKNLIHSHINTENLSFPIYDYYHRQYPNRNDINKFIPIAKHYERCEEYFTQINFTHHSEFYNKAIECFYTIESSGISVDTTLIDDYFAPHNTLHSIKNNVIYSQYNVDTTTKRPSNSFNSINFAALPKDGSRKAFVSTNGKLIDIDISSVSLIVPVSISSSKRTQFLRRKIFDKFEKISAFHHEIRPRPLFHGVEQRISIISATRGPAMPHQYRTTGFLRHNAGERMLVWRALMTKLNKNECNNIFPKVSPLDFTFYKEFEFCE